MLGGKDVMVVLTSAEAVRDVLEKQSAATASRPSTYLDRVVHDGKYFVMTPYCEPISIRAAAPARRRDLCSAHLEGPP
jgi:hypothetical protein